MLFIDIKYNYIYFNVYHLRQNDWNFLFYRYNLQL